MTAHERGSTVFAGIMTLSAGLWIIGIAAATLSIKTALIGAAVVAAGFLVMAIATREERGCR